MRVSANADLVYVGGQIGVDTNRQRRCTRPRASGTPLANLQECLAASGASLEDVVKWTILVREGEPLQDGFAAFSEAWGQRPNPPAITVAFVAGLALPDAVVEIEAAATVTA